MWATSYSVCAIGKAHPSIFLFKWWSPCVIMSSNVNRRSWEESKSASWRMRSRAQPSVCDWLFSWTQSTDKDSKGGPSGNGIKKMCPASLLQSREKGLGNLGLEATFSYFPAPFCDRIHISLIVSDSPAPCIHISHRGCLIYLICCSLTLLFVFASFLMSGI